MVKVKLFIADTDCLYVENLVKYLVSKADNFEIDYSTDFDTFFDKVTKVEQKNIIIAVTKEFVNEKIINLPIETKILLADSEVENIEGFKNIVKYQRADNIVNEITMLYTENTGDVNLAVTGNRDTKVIGLYSPIGGSGKTSMALALCMLFNDMGKKSFYLNLENICSVSSFLTENGMKSMSDILISLKSRNVNVGLRILANRCHNELLGIDYIPMTESAIEINELTETEFENLIDAFEELKEYDYVFVDFSSDYGMKTLEMLKCCDKIIMPICQDCNSLRKLAVFLSEFDKHEILKNMRDKFEFILNRCVQTHQEIALFKPLLGKIPISAVLADAEKYIYDKESIRALLAGVYPVILN